MIEEEPARTLDLHAVRVAIEGDDQDLLLGFYSDDAELRIVNSGAPGSQAFVLRGKVEIEKYLRSVSGQRMRIRIETVGEENIRFSEVCEYPDGSRILIRTTLELSEGIISRQRDVVEHKHDGAGQRNQGK